MESVRVRASTGLPALLPTDYNALRRSASAPAPLLTRDELAQLEQLVDGDAPTAFGALLDAFNARRALMQQPAIDDVAAIITATSAARTARGRRGAPL